MLSFNPGLVWARVELMETLKAPKKAEKTSSPPYCQNIVYILFVWNQSVLSCHYITAFFLGWNLFETQQPLQSLVPIFRRIDFAVIVYAQAVTESHGSDK